MLFFVSDLHFTDAPEASGIHVPSFLARLEEAVGAAREGGAESLTLVLLGDIFELLKSPRWLATTARPWLPDSAEKEAAVSAVFDGIVGSNAPFFRRLAALTRGAPPLALVYIPGNHDHEMNTPAGRGARARLAELLPGVVPHERPFRTSFLNEEHGVLARHGHEWDPANRTRGELAALGDVVVIELLVRLPRLVFEGLGREGLDPRWYFLYELDNVRPQDPRHLAQWLVAGLARLGDDGPATRRILRDALAEIASRFAAVLSEARFEAVAEGEWWIKFFSRLLSAAARRVGVLETALRLPRGGHGEGPNAHLALLDLQTARHVAPGLTYLVCGHTHLPEVVPLGLPPSRGAPLYLNTGTWRRVHRAVDVAVDQEAPRFASLREECLVAIASPAEERRGFPAHRIERITRSLSP